MIVLMRTYTLSRALRLTRLGNGIWDWTSGLSTQWRRSGQKTRTARNCTVIESTRRGGEVQKNTLKHLLSKKTCFLYVGVVLKQRGNGDRNLEMADSP